MDIFNSKCCGAHLVCSECKEKTKIDETDITVRIESALNYIDYGNLLDEDWMDSVEACRRELEQLIRELTV